MSNSPYPGLRSFHRARSRHIFGRDEQVDQLLIRLGKSRFLAVGRTFRLRQIIAGTYRPVELHWKPVFSPRSAALAYCTMQPGSHPMRNLAEALVEHIGSDGCPPSGEGRGEGFLKSENTNPPSELQVTPSSDTGTSTTNESPRHGCHRLSAGHLRRGLLGLIEALQGTPFTGNTNLCLSSINSKKFFRYREHQDRTKPMPLSRCCCVPSWTAFSVYIVIYHAPDFLGDCALFPDFRSLERQSVFDAATHS